MSRFLKNDRKENPLSQRDLIEVEERDLDQILLEKINLGLRTTQGINIQEIEQQFNRLLIPSEILKIGLDQGFLKKGIAFSP